MSRARYTRPIETLSNIDIWLNDPEITELRRAELLAARDRVAAIRTAVMINGVMEDDDGSGDKEVVDAKRKRSKKSKVR